MKETYLFLAILFLHFIADFIMQDEEWAKDKSNSMNALLCHTIIYSIILFVGMLPIFYYSFEVADLIYIWWLSVTFSCISLVFHTITDFFTSKIVKKKFENKHYGSRIPNFGAFTIIGFDQFLHFVQLFLTYKLLL